MNAVETPSMDREEHHQNGDACGDLHSSMPGASKASNSRRYGSTGTISTELYTTSSSSTVSSTSRSNDNQYQHHRLRLDLASIDNGDSDGEESTLLPTNYGHHSRESSYSDISDGGNYSDRFARYRQRSREGGGCSEFFGNSVLTVNNFKVALSFASWFVSYMIMGVFGGTVAYMHFERSDSSVPDPLPDFGYDVIPVSRDCCFLLICAVMRGHTRRHTKCKYICDQHC